MEQSKNIKLLKPLSSEKYDIAVFNGNADILDSSIGNLNTQLNSKVDKVSGKQLSTNDLTNALKQNYDSAYSHSTSTHAPANAEKNTIVTIKQNGKNLTPDDNRIVDLGTVLTGGEQTSTSSADGGSNVYIFSDGSTITVKNGSKGSQGNPGKDGTNGTSVTVASVSESDTDGGNNTITFSDGTSITIKNGTKGAKGDKGDAGINATTTAVASTIANGLMSSTDKINLNTVMSALALATCSTARNATAKVATLANFVLKPGVTIAVKFTNTTTTNPSSGNLTLNVNNTGAKTIAYTRNGTIGVLTYAMAGAFYNNLAHVFTYNGTYWVCLSYNVDSNTWTPFKGATASANGIAGYIPAPTKGNQDKFFRADGTWATPSTGSGTISYSATEPPALENNMTWIGSKGD